MQIQIRFLIETFTTDATLEWLLATMDTFMNLHIIFKTEHLAAHVAFIRLFPRMSNAMPPQLARIIENNATVGIWTGIGLRRSIMLDLQVALVARLVKKRLIAIFANWVFNSVLLLYSIMFSLVLIDELGLAFWFSPFFIWTLRSLLG
jgi:hypothetical protein